MPMQYTWDIKQINVVPEYEGHTDVVYSIVWSLTGTSEEVSAQTEGAVLTKDGDRYRFTNYKDLTKDQMLSWVFSLLSKEEKTKAETLVAKMIDSLKTTQSVVSKPLPWDK